MPLEDLQQASQLLVQALDIREKYMNNSRQSYPSITSRFLRSIDKRPVNLDDEVQHDDRMAIEGLRKTLSSEDTSPFLTPRYSMSSFLNPGSILPNPLTLHILRFPKKGLYLSYEKTNNTNF